MFDLSKLKHTTPLIRAGVRVDRLMRRLTPMSSEWERHRQARERIAYAMTPAEFSRYCDLRDFERLRRPNAAAFLPGGEV